VCAALLSSLRGRALPLDAVYIGEVGLTGEVRAVSALDRRLGEAARHGFRSALVPQGRALDPAAAGLRATAIADIAELADRAVP
jgi:DNA repair protein RadA/Sms